MLTCTECMSNCTRASHPLSYSTSQHCCVTAQSSSSCSERLGISHTQILTTPERLSVRQCLRREEVRQVLSHMHFLWPAAVLRNVLSASREPQLEPQNDWNEKFHLRPVERWVEFLNWDCFLCREHDFFTPVEVFFAFRGLEAAAGASFSQQQRDGSGAQPPLQVCSPPFACWELWQRRFRPSWE